MLFQDGVILDYGKDKKSSSVKFKELELDILRIFQERILGSEAINSITAVSRQISCGTYVTNFRI